MSDQHVSIKPILAEIVLPARNLQATVDFFIDRLGLRLESITPADDPQIAQLSGHNISLRLDCNYSGHAGTIRFELPEDEAASTLTAPNGTLIECVPASPVYTMPELEPALSIQKLSTESNDWIVGRAGMQYRDLIPDRQGGRFIASHIRIPEGGPVPDHVHFHNIRFQLIYCYRGWVRLVYEDQGDPFIMKAGDCVLQPPNIRHRVLEASDGLEVIEIGSPARHMTHLDHELILPTQYHHPQRHFSGQLFAFHQKAKAAWHASEKTGFEVRDLGISKATDGLVSAQVLRLSHPFISNNKTHNKELWFTFILAGQMSLQHGQQQTELSTGDAFVIPAGMTYCFLDCTDDLELFELKLPA